MEPIKLDDKKIIEIFMGLILIVLLIILVFTITAPTTNAKTAASTTITNSYNTYNLDYDLNYNIEDDYPNYKTKYIYDDDYKTRYIRDRDDYKRYNHDDYYKKFYTYSRCETSKGIFRNDIDKYFVYVKNKDSSDYFTVTFNFEDRDGKEHSSSITKYIKADEEIKFTYTDVNGKYRDWDYDVDVN